MFRLSDERFQVVGRYAKADESMKRAVVTQGIVFVGMFVFAIIIGIISDEIASKVEEVKTGNSKVVETDHTAGWFIHTTTRVRAQL